VAGPRREAGPGYAGVDERLDLPVVLPPTLDVVDLTGARVLVADDVADTGRTLELVRDFCAGHVTEVPTAVVHEKPQSVVPCDYVWRRTDRWIDFPWSSLPPSSGAATAQLAECGPPAVAGLAPLSPRQLGLGLRARPPCEQRAGSAAPTR